MVAIEGTRLAQMKQPPGVIVARDGFEDVVLPLAYPSHAGDLGPQILAMLEPGGECVVYAATYQWDQMNLCDLWRRGARLGTLSREDPTKRRRKRRLVR